MKTIRFALLLVSVVYAISLYAQPTADEARLYQLIMEYRASKGLPSIPLSVSLTEVAQIHAKDMYFYYNEVPNGCNMHSWSGHGPWKKCDYYEDHRNAQGMWDKPRELTSYQGDGFEIAHSFFPPTSSICSPEGALEGWKHSSGHNAVIININGWASTQWNAIGVGMYKGCACAWFGKEQDPAGTYSVADYVKNNRNSSASSNSQQLTRKVWTHLALQYSPKADAGLMFGVCGNRVGGYVSGRYNIGLPHMRGNFKPAVADNTFGINSWSVDGGLLFRLCQTVFLYAGVGYENYESAGTKFKASPQLQGANVEAGLIINIHGRSGKGFTITGGYNTMLNKEYFRAMSPLTNIVAGIGFML